MLILSLVTSNLLICAPNSSIHPSSLTPRPAPRLSSPSLPPLFNQSFSTYTRFSDLESPLSILSFLSLLHYSSFQIPSPSGEIHSAFPFCISPLCCLFYSGLSLEGIHPYFPPSPLLHPFRSISGLTVPLPFISPVPNLLSAFF